MLAAGIDVFSTVNVQHLESLNDQVAELTGVRVRETVPDSVLGARRRGRPHRPHPGGADRAPAGRARSTRARTSTPRSTTSSRSRTWRRCARSACARSPRTSSPSGSSSARPRRSARAGRSGSPADTPKAVGERLLALVRPQPSAQRLVRRAWRSAQRLGHRPRPALGEAAGQADRGRERAPGDGAAPARLGARRDAADRGARRPRRRGRPGRPRARHHLHHGRRVRPAARPRRACANRCRSG